MNEVKSIDKTDSVRVLDGMASRQLPASLITAADVVFSEMCRRGSSSPELRVYYGTIRGLAAWYAEWGAFTCWSSTPWGAVSQLSRQIAEITKSEVL